MNMSLLLRTAVFAAFCTACGATSLSKFIIVSSANPQIPGGTFDNGATYRGTFTFDTSLIPATGPFSMSIPQFDMIYNFPGGSVETAPWYFDTATLSGTPVTIGGHLLSYDVIKIDGGIMELDLVTPLGVFPGGAIQYAFAASFSTSVTDGVDTRGTALLVDPQILDTPEPATVVATAAGLLVFGLISIHRRVRAATADRNVS